MAQVQRKKLLFHFIIDFIIGAVLWFFSGSCIQSSCSFSPPPRTRVRYRGLFLDNGLYF